MTCSKCGSDVVDGAAFCASCGTPTRSPDAATVAMKFVRGRALDSIIESQGALPINVVTRILAASAAGLAHAHEHGVVHRDIKGANILIELDGRPLVADFGIARAMTENSLTASGM